MTRLGLSWGWAQDELSRSLPVWAVLWFYAAFLINSSWNFQHTVPYWTSLLHKIHFWLSCSKILHLEITCNEISLSFLFRFSGVTQFLWQANKSDTMPYLWDRSSLGNPLLGYMEGGGDERKKAWSLYTLDETGITVQTPLHHNSWKCWQAQMIFA